MQQRMYRIQADTWQARIGAVIGVALALGLAVALIILSFTLAVILLPVVAVLLAIGWWRWRKIEKAMREQAGSGPGSRNDDSIEIEYEIVNDKPQASP